MSQQSNQEFVAQSPHGPVHLGKVRASRARLLCLGGMRPEPLKSPCSTSPGRVPARSDVVRSNGFAKGMMDNNHQRGRGLLLSRDTFEAQASPDAALLVGSPQEVIDKLLSYRELYGVSRAIIQMGFGGMPQKQHLAAIERLGTEVAPVVRRETADRTGVAA